MKSSPNKELTSLAAEVVRLSRLLTKERASIPVAYLKDKGLRKAYLSYYLPSNLSKIHLPLEELSLHQKNVLSKEHLRILDVGSGPGSATLGVLEFFSRLEKTPVLEFTVADHVAENLKDAAALFASNLERCRINASLHSVKTSVEKLAPLLKGHYDLIILSNVLNELFRNDEERIVRRIDILNEIIKHFLAYDGSCIIIEPALHDTSREMLLVRDGLLAQGFHVYSPCLMNENCPALVNPKDWCHEDVPWDPPAIIKEIDKLAGLRKDSLKFSYAVLRKDNLSLMDYYGPDSFRIVSEPIISKGKIEFYLCGKGGRRLIMKLDKDESPANEAFGALKRGNIVSFEKLLDEGKRYKVGKDTEVIAKNTC
ncbi:MAG TPA: small ribosomal subunit Rsm22 family protein [Nitrospirota bacterium]|nr:small ribosomal subunit Rsm22 family protein [Nitrospirota bacterium]